MWSPLIKPGIRRLPGWPKSTQIHSLSLLSMCSCPLSSNTRARPVGLLVLSFWSCWLPTHHPHLCGSLPCSLYTQLMTQESLYPHILCQIGTGLTTEGSGHRIDFLLKFPESWRYSRLGRQRRVWNGSKSGFLWYSTLNILHSHYG